MDTQQPEVNTATTETDEQRDVRMNKDVAAFSYVWIMSVVVLAARRDSAFAQYHAKQATILFIVSIPVALLPFVGRYLIFLVLAGMLLGFIHAANGRREPVPIIGDLASGKKTPRDLYRSCLPYIKRITDTCKQLVRKPAARPTPAPAATPQPSGHTLDNTPPTT